MYYNPTSGRFSSIFLRSSPSSSNESLYSHPHTCPPLLAWFSLCVGLVGEHPNPPRPIRQLSRNAERSPLEKAGERGHCGDEQLHALILLNAELVVPASPHPSHRSLLSLCTKGCPVSHLPKECSREPFLPQYWLRFCLSIHQ